MKKIVRYTLIFTLFLVVICLVGCVPVYLVSVEYRNNYNDDLLVDLLIPISDDDDSYTVFDENAAKWFYGLEHTYTYDDLDMAYEYFEKTEIANYDKDGYRSVLAHHRHIFTSDREESRIDFGTKDYYLNFCRKYKKAKIVLFDRKGHILHVSEEFPLLLHSFFTPSDLFIYDIETNEVTTEYKNSDPTALCIYWAVAIIAVYYAFIGLLSVIILELTKSFKKRPFSYFAKVYGLCSIPSIAIFIMNIADVVLSDPNYGKIEDNISQIGEKTIYSFYIFFVPMICIVMIILSAALDPKKKK